jgi:uncharacterized protein YbjT (DUF2867 family)
VRIALFGITGGIGRLFADQALAAGHELRALARDPSKVHRVHERLAIYQGDLITGAGVSDVVEKTELIISCVGPSGDRNPIVSRGLRHILQAAQNTTVKRMAFISSLGVGDSREQCLRMGWRGHLFLRVIVPLFLKKHFDDLDEAERVAQESAIPVVRVRPSGLVDKPPIGRIVAAGPDMDVPGRIARADVAAFLLSLVADTRWDGKGVSIGAE